MQFLSLFLIAILLFSVVKPIYAPPAENEEYWPPFTSKKHPYGLPLFQFRGGASVNDVRCDSDFVLVVKHSGSPACVTLDTKIELIIRGWTQDDRLLLGCIGDRVQKCYPQDKAEYQKLLHKYYYGNGSAIVIPRSDLFLQQPLKIEGLNETYNVGEKIEFTINFNGTKSGCYSYPSLKIENSEHQKVWEGNYIVEFCDPDFTSTHYEKVWKTSDSPLGIPIINQTGFYTLFVTYGDAIIQKDIVIINENEN